MSRDVIWLLRLKAEGFLRHLLTAPGWKPARQAIAACRLRGKVFSRGGPLVLLGPPPAHAWQLDHRVSIVWPDERGAVLCEDIRFHFCSVANKRNSWDIAFGETLRPCQVIVEQIQETDADV